MSRVIAGTLLRPDGAPVGGARIYLTAKRNEVNNIVQGVDAFFLTNSDGTYSQSVVNGYYGVSVEYTLSSAASARRWALGEISVESGASISLNELLQFSVPPDSGVAGQMQEWYEAVMAAVPVVEAAKVSAQNSATAAAGSAATASGAATAAAGSAGAASSSASSASASATTATNAATTATAAANAATTKAGEAGVSATNAQISANAAAASAASVTGVVSAAEAARDAAVSAKNEAQASSDNAESSATAAAGSEVAAAGSASDAAASASTASDAADTATDKAGEAQTSATAAAGSEIAAAGSATAASNSANQAGDSAAEAASEAGASVAARNDAEGFSVAASGWAAKAQNFANMDEDVPVPDSGGLYSAKHWAAKAEQANPQEITTSVNQSSSFVTNKSASIGNFSITFKKLFNMVIVSGSVEVVNTVGSASDHILFDFVDSITNGLPSPIGGLASLNLMAGAPSVATASSCAVMVESASGNTKCYLRRSSSPTGGVAPANTYYFNGGFAV